MLLIRITTLIIVAISMAPINIEAASCCGGGGSSSLVLPKIAKYMVAAAGSFEKYNGFYNNAGKYLKDPPKSNLSQYRSSLSGGMRLSKNIQANLSLPYVWNVNTYSGQSSNTNGLGDTSLGLWYEFFERMTCVWKVRKLKDLMPAAYLGMGATIPTGISPYDDIDNSFDITGRGFYRFDVKVLIEKTVYPFNLGLTFDYGKHLKRPINKEFGRYVDPYYRVLGDRLSGSITFGYTYFFENMASLTTTLAYSHLEELNGKVDEAEDPTYAFYKNSVALNLAFSNGRRSHIYRAGYNRTLQRKGWGSNYPVTRTFTVEVTYVIR